MSVKQLKICLRGEMLTGNINMGIANILAIFKAMGLDEFTKR